MRRKHAHAMSRALTIGLRAWTFDPEDHPALSTAVVRTRLATLNLSGGWST